MSEGALRVANRFAQVVAQPVFSYGSNNPYHLRQILGHDVETIGAVALGYERVYRGFSERWGGGVASLEPHEKAKVFGSVALLGPHDLAHLDAIEGVARGEYRREPIVVLLSNGRPMKALAYVSTSPEFNPPSPEYLKEVQDTVQSYKERFWGDWTREDAANRTATFGPMCSDGKPAQYNDGRDRYECPSTGEKGPNGPAHVADNFPVVIEDERQTLPNPSEVLERYLEKTARPVPGL
jgi:gamma-glutamylcyclotransferase (GGCT)/AIG2-like uncharacterized protein YtfP